MKRIAVVSDIHGNAVALEALIADLGREPVDAVICLGDIAAIGPQPCECIARLRSLGWPIVQGNTDAWLADPQPVRPANDNARAIEEIELWGAARLDDADRAFLRSLEPTITVPLGEAGTMLAYHGAPASYSIEIRPQTPAAELDLLFAGHRASLYAGGHTHEPMIRTHHDDLVLNPGSVGLPFLVGSDGATTHPHRIEYAIVTTDGPHISIDLRRIPLDTEQLRAAILATDMPHQDWLLRRWRL